MRRSGELAVLIGAALLAGAGWFGWKLWGSVSQDVSQDVSQEAAQIVAPMQAVARHVPQLIKAGGSAEPSQASASAVTDAAIEIEDPLALRESFDALRWPAERPAELQALPRRIDAKLPLLLSRGAIDAREALLWKADLLEALEPDPTQRRMQLLAWWREHPLQGRAREPPELDTRRRAEGLLLQWQAQPSEDRDVGELEEMLDELEPTRLGDMR